MKRQKKMDKATKTFVKEAEKFINANVGCTGFSVCVEMESDDETSRTELFPCQRAFLDSMRYCENCGYTWDCDIGDLAWEEMDWPTFDVKAACAEHCQYMKEQEG
jgi:hypothetical protein